MKSRIAAVIWLWVVWVALWEQVTILTVVGGLVVALVLVRAFPTAARRGRGLHAFRPLAVLSFIGYFVVKIVQANAIVAWEVITPGNKVNEGIVAVPFTGASDTIITLLASAISLTPGTLVIEVQRDPAVLYVHVLHLRSIRDVTRDLFELERRLTNAIGSDSCLAGVKARIEELESTDEPATEPDQRPGATR